MSSSSNNDDDAEIKASSQPPASHNEEKSPAQHIKPEIHQQGMEAELDRRPIGRRNPSIAAAIDRVDPSDKTAISSPVPASTTPTAIPLARASALTPDSARSDRSSRSDRSRRSDRSARSELSRRTPSRAAAPSPDGPPSASTYPSHIERLRRKMRDGHLLAANEMAELEKFVHESEAPSAATGRPASSQPEASVLKLKSQSPMLRNKLATPPQPPPAIPPPSIPGRDQSAIITSKLLQATATAPNAENAATGALPSLSPTKKVDVPALVPPSPPARVDSSTDNLRAPRGPRPNLPDAAAEPLDAPRHVPPLGAASAPPSTQTAPRGGVFAQLAGGGGALDAVGRAAPSRAPMLGPRPELAAAAGVLDAPGKTAPLRSRPEVAAVMNVMGGDRPASTCSSAIRSPTPDVRPDLTNVPTTVASSSTASSRVPMFIPPPPPLRVESSTDSESLRHAAAYDSPSGSHSCSRRRPARLLLELTSSYVASKRLRRDHV